MRIPGIVITAALAGLMVSGCGSSGEATPEVVNTGGPELSTTSGTGDPDADACAAAAVKLGYASPVVLMVAGPDAVGVQCSVQVSTGAIVQIILPSDGSAPATIGVP